MSNANHILPRHHQRVRTFICRAHFVKVDDHWVPDVDADKLDPTSVPMDEQINAWIREEVPWITFTSPPSFATEFNPAEPDRRRFLIGQTIVFVEPYEQGVGRPANEPAGTEAGDGVVGESSGEPVGTAPVVADSAQAAHLPEVVEQPAG